MKVHQKKLLKLLATNCRYKNKDLAKSLRVSEDTINYTKQEFLKKDIFKYSIFFDYRKLGYDIYHLMFSLKEIRSLDLNKLKKIKDIIYINTFVGKYDLQVIVLIRDNYKDKNDEISSIFEKKILSKVEYKYESELKLCHILPEFDIEVSTPKNQKEFIYNLDSSILSIEKYELGYKLDKKDLLIINSLLENPNSTYWDIQKKTKISRETIRERIKKYIADKFLLSLTILPNFKFFNYNTYCLLLNLKNINKDKLKKFIFEKNYVFYVEIISGEKNLFFYVWAKNPSDFSEKFKEIKSYFKDEIEDIDLLFYDEHIFQKEFPSSLLD